MKICLKWVSALAATVLLAGFVMAADAVSAGKVKSINAANKEFVLTDAAGKDWTIKLGDNVVMNRGGKESQSDLKVGDPVNVSYDKGVLTWTAHYILVQEGDSKNCELLYGTVKSYDGSTKQLTFDEHGKEWTFPMGTAKLQMNKQDIKAGDLKIGDSALVIMEKAGDKSVLKAVMVDRK